MLSWFGIVRAFNQMRRMISTHKGLAVKLAELERKFESHDVQIHGLLDAIRDLLAPPAGPPKQIGFRP